MSTLCRKCFHLVSPGEEWLVCTSEPCAGIEDVNGEVHRRVMDPRKERGLRPWFRRRVKLDAACPYCGQIDTLRYACPRCKSEIPDTRTTDDHLIAVLGAKEAGKTHYLATLYHVLAEAEKPAGEALWDVELDEDRRRALREELWRPLFEAKQELRATPLRYRFDMHLVLRHRQTRRRILVAFQDLSGEVQTDSELLPAEEFLLHASGVILLADPLALPRTPKGRWSQPHHEDLPTCTRVLDNYLSALKMRSRRVASREEQAARRLLPEHKVLAVAVTKADLVLRNRSHSFWTGAGDGVLEGGYWERRQPESAEVQSWVREHAGRDLGRLAQAFADVSYFFVSSYGYEHKPHTAVLVKPPTPLRVHEPLFALLDRFGARSVAPETSTLPRI